MSQNPLLDFSGLTRFAEIKPEHISPAIDELLSAARAAVKRLTAEQGAPSWESFVDPLTDATEHLGRAWGVVGHLNAVVNTPELREAYNANIPRISEFWTEMGQNLDLFARFKALAASPEHADYSAARKKIVSNDLRDFRLSGAELPQAEKERFAAIQTRLAELSAKFEQNVLDATDAFSLYIEDKAELAGVPEDSLELFAAAAAGDDKSGYKITLQFPFYFPVLQYADNRALREKLYQANVQRASEFGPAERDNSPIIREKLQLAREEAQLLDFANFAELSLFTKMAESPEQVIAFLRDLAARAKPFAIKDRQELEAFAAAELGLAKLEAWDLAYAAEKLRVARYAFSEQEVKQYFPESKVLPGLFGVVSTLFGVEVRPSSAPVWHPDVRFFDIHKDGQLVGSFYFDLYARDGKRSGAWMDDARGRRSKSGQVQTPIAYLTCNFTRPVGDKPALFTHDEVITLFHEFGHGLHHMLTRVDELGVAGINGVEWDAVELPSQFLENFAWEWDVVQGMTRHVDSGAALPRELFDKMLAAKNFQSGMATVRQLEFALFDLQLYSVFDADKGDWLALLEEVRREVAVNFPPAYNRFPNSFSHIFAGGYSAGYYSYKWAEVLSADAYAAFEEAGGANPDTGKRFWDEILAVGGSRPALESFRAFRGRDPQIDALLRHSGMVETV
ncbi:oligopeptidase A [Chromobacterium alkanivorans]|uniref:M3 family metallopeptidase n=1 Tax=Chromobacterium alkanivorans TaxID=1071719 RepID=UPI0019678A01|nr:M3 family metallopeptidase [Chromobacterium alkanivorans]MBN3002548.1 M3 family metallopeptidase [Chromobacterium alkanivorans]MCS3802809.1 oligopeptidase A [Chromobacterium alkanivorans]MCS3817135.1 oligopeptidase A [Chromobacterium alkanivorans]MCS3872175.1 oligopeptidase A [Chromobacterium alkanivorans]